MSKTKIRNITTELKTRFEGGASRSSSNYAYHLIPPCATRAMSRRWMLGEKKHGEGNWKHGGVNFIKQCFNHLFNHYNKELEGDFDHNIEQEEDYLDNLGAIAWNAAALCWFKKYKTQQYRQALDELHIGIVDK